MKRITIEQERDETGDFEEFSWDLFPLVQSAETAHLQDCGVPKAGVELKPGMIIVGRIGKTKHFDADHQPNCLEKHGFSFEELRDKYGRMWQDRSLYTTAETCGKVISARVDRINGKLRGIVEIER